MCVMRLIANTKHLWGAIVYVRVHSRRTGTAYIASPNDAVVSASYSTTPLLKSFPDASLSFRRPLKSEVVDTRCNLRIIRYGSLSEEYCR